MKNLFTSQLLNKKMLSTSGLGHQLFALSSKTFGLFLLFVAVSMWTVLIVVKTYGWQIYYQQQNNKYKQTADELISKHQLTSAAIHSRQQLLERFERLIPASKTFIPNPIREPLALLNHYRERIGFTLVQATIDDQSQVVANSDTSSGKKQPAMFTFQLRGTWQQFAQLFSHLNKPHQPIVVTQLLIERLAKPELLVSLWIQSSSNRGTAFNRQWLNQQETLNNALQEQLNDITDVLLQKHPDVKGLSSLVHSKLQSEASAPPGTLAPAVIAQAKTEQTSEQSTTTGAYKQSPFHVQVMVDDTENCAANHRPAIRFQDTSLSDLAFRGIGGEEQSMQAIIENLPEQQLILLNLNQWAFSPPLELVNIEADKLTFNTYQFDNNCRFINLGTEMIMPKSARTMD